MEGYKNNSFEEEELKSGSNYNSPDPDQKGKQGKKFKNIKINDPNYKEKGGGPSN
jgi:hypothetical protein